MWRIMLYQDFRLLFRSLWLAFWNHEKSKSNSIVFKNKEVCRYKSLGNIL